MKVYKKSFSFLLAIISNGTVFASGAYDVVDIKCNPECEKNDNYGANGLCENECGEGSYCCRKDGLKNRCTQSTLDKAQFPANIERHYCLVPRESEYTLVDEKLSWNSAVNHCESLGQRLAVPRNEEQQKLIFDLGSPTRSWIGISDQDKEGNWIDVYGKPVTYTAFYITEPNGNIGENCVHLYHNQDANTYSSWNDDNCSKLKNFICEKDLTALKPAVFTNFGRFTGWKRCPKGSYAAAFSSYHERPEGDDTALNGIFLQCYIYEDRKGEAGYVQMWPESQGTVGAFFSEKCESGEYINAVRIRSERFQYSRDDTATNAVEMRCSDSKKTLEAPETTPWGTWSVWEECPNGQVITGINLQIEDRQGNGDDTSVNHIYFECTTVPHITKVEYKMDEKKIIGTIPLLLGRDKTINLCQASICTEQKGELVISGREMETTHWELTEGNSISFGSKFEFKPVEVVGISIEVSRTVTESHTWGESGISASLYYFIKTSIFVSIFGSS